MQTFLPYADFNKSAQVLDSKRLNKQLVECQQIFNALCGNSKGWTNHPVTNMWRGHRRHLWHYIKALHSEWLKRGGNTHKSAIKVCDYLVEFAVDIPITEIDAPAWIGLEEVHSAYRANLLRKDPIHYGKFGWAETPMEGYPYELCLNAMKENK